MESAASRVLKKLTANSATVYLTVILRTQKPKDWN